MNYWLVANPEAGDGERGRDFWLERLAGAGIRSPECCDFKDQSWHSRVKPGDVVMVAGGDGSANLGAGLCLKTGATLAILPSGTANDFSRNLGLPGDPADLCGLIAQGRTERVDVASWGDALFLNVAHVGLGTLPVTSADGSRKKLFGRFSYGLELLSRVNARRGFWAEIQCGKARVSGRWLSVAVANGGYYGGGNEIPEAAANDGVLEIIAVKPRPLVQLVLTFLLLRLNRQSPRRTSTLVHLKGEQCSVRTRKPKTVTADGELAGETPLQVSCRPGKLNVIATRVVTIAPEPAEG